PGVGPARRCTSCIGPSQRPPRTPEKPGDRDPEKITAAGNPARAPGSGGAPSVRDASRLLRPPRTRPTGPADRPPPLPSGGPNRGCPVRTRLAHAERIRPPAASVSDGADRFLMGSPAVLHPEGPYSTTGPMIGRPDLLATARGPVVPPPAWSRGGPVTAH